MIDWVVSLLADKSLGDAVVRLFQNPMFLITSAVVIVLGVIIFSGM